jgi:hypothetical protein
MKFPDDGNTLDWEDNINKIKFPFRVVINFSGHK